MADWVTRFCAKVDSSAGPDACWPWTGACSQAAGRRRREWTGNTKRPRFALVTYCASLHRASVLVYAAPLMLSLTDGIPLDERRAAGLYACHKPICPNPICVNPQHLYWGTHEENVRDRYPMRTEGADD